MRHARRRLASLALLIAALLTACSQEHPEAPPELGVRRLPGVPGLTFEGARRAVEGGPLSLSLERDPAGPLPAFTLEITGGPFLPAGGGVLEVAQGEASYLLPILVQDDMDINGLRYHDLVMDITSDDPTLDGRRVTLQGIAIVDDDGPRLSISPAPLPGLIEGDSLPLQIQLVEPPFPSTSWTFTASVQGAGLNAAPASFTWSSQDPLPLDPWTLLLEAAQDDIAAEDRTVVLRLRASSANSGDPLFTDLLIEELTLDIAEDDTAGVALTQLTSAPLVEGATQERYTLALTSQPAASVTLTWAPIGFQLVPSSLTFTAANWDTPQTLEVRYPEDDQDDPSRTVTLNGNLNSADPVYDAIAAPQLSLRLEDNDTAGLSVAVMGAPSVAEGGPPVSLPVALRSRPRNPVTVAVMAPGGLQANPATLTFTAAAWNTPQSVALTAPEDDALAPVNPQLLTVRLVATSTDAGYSGAALDVPVSRVDNDRPGLLVDPTALRAAEGAPVTFSVALAAAPEEDINLDLSATAGLDVTPTRLTFLADGDAGPQQVTVTPRVDPTYNPGRTERVTLRVEADAPAAWAALDPVTVDVIVDEPAAPRIEVAPASAAEGDEPAGGRLTFEATLSAPAAAPVTLRWATEDGAALADLDYTPGEGVLTFPPGAQRASFEVRLVPDERAEPEEDLTVTLALDNPALTLATSRVTGRILDDDAAPEITPAALETPAGVPLVGVLAWSDADSPEVTFSTLVEPEVGVWTWTDPGAGAFTYAPPSDFTGQVQVQVQVSDGVNLSPPTAVLVTIGAATGEPRVTLVAPQQVEEGAEVRVDALLSGVSGQVITWRWDLDGDGVFLDALQPTARFDAPGEDTLEIAARASWPGGSAEARATLAILNLPPRLEAPATLRADEGLPALLRLDASDPGGDPLEITWRFDDGQSVTAPAPQGLELAWTWPGDGAQRVQIEARDGEGGVTSAEVQVTVANVAPRLLGGLPVEAPASAPYAAEAWAWDPGDDALNWRLLGVSPFALGEACEAAPPLFCQRLSAPPLTAVETLRLRVNDGADNDTLTLEITPQGADSDGGGASNLCEDAAGADPTDPGDDQQDPDGDGVSLALACALGRDPSRSGLPGAPTLLEPLDGALVQGGVVTLRVAEASDPDGDLLLTTLEVRDAEGALVATLPNLLAQEGEIKAYIQGELLEDARYSWTARAADRWGEGPTSAPWSFRWSSYNAPPPPPRLLNPAPGEVSPGALRLTAQAAPDPEGEAVTVELELIPAQGDAARASGPLAVEEGGSGEVTWEAGTVEAGEAWSWRGRAVDASGVASAWTPPVELVGAGGGPGPLDAPTLEEPLNGARLPLDEPVLLRWSPAGEAPDAWEIELIDPDGAAQVVEPAAGDAPERAVTLEEAGSWRWRVRALRGQEAGAWSEVRRFTLADGPPGGVRTELGCAAAQGRAGQGGASVAGLLLLLAAAWGVGRRR